MLNPVTTAVEAEREAREKWSVTSLQEEPSNERD